MRKFIELPLSLIDFEDTTYSLNLWNEPPDRELSASVTRFGILHPPLLYSAGAGSYKIVAGRKRLAAAKALQPHGRTLCGIIPVDAGQAEIFALILEEAQTGRPLTIIEQIVFLEKLTAAASAAEALPMLEKMGLKPQQHILANLLKLGALGRSALQALHNGTLHEKNGRKLLNLDEKGQELIINLIRELRFGGSKQQKLIDFCIELVKRTGKGLDEILADAPSVREQGQPGNIPQYGDALLQWLTDQCFPRLSQAENEFKKRAAGLALPSRMQISHTPAFEDEAVTLSIRFNDWNSLRRAAAEIKTLIRCEEIEGKP